MLTKDALLAVFRLREDEGPSKLTTLAEAIRRHIRPGMAIQASGESGASLRELVRQFYGTKPHFTLLIEQPGGTHALLAVHAGLVKRLVFTNCSDIYPAPSPNPIVQRAFRQKEVLFENWSVLTFLLRLMAGALGIGFMPTRSLVGTDAAIENADSFQVIDDPFGSGKKLGLVRAFNPDVALIHGLAADAYGNTITAPFSASTRWGAKGSRHGAMVTVERLVSTEFIRKHAHLVTIPGHMVRAVVVAPLGAHPQYLADMGLPGLGYGLDTNYLRQFRAACEQPEGADAWLREWVLECSDHAAYLRKLGDERAAALRRQGAAENWDEQAAALWEEVSIRENGYNGVEWQVVVAARRIRDAIVRAGYRTLFAGVGVSGLSGWLAYYLLRRAGQHVDMLPMGIGFLPRPGDPFLLNLANVKTAAMVCETIDIHGTIVTGEYNSCLGVLGAGQVDKHGNINASKISEQLYLAGMAGGNDIASGAREVVVVARQARSRFLERVTYLSQPGDRVSTLVSQLGIFEKRGGELVLTGYFPNAKLGTVAEHVAEIRANCGWDLQVASEIVAVAPPASEELLLLRMLDPQGHFIGER